MGYRPTLIGAGVIVVGGANYAYDIVRKGTVDASTEKRSVDDGLWGVVDGVEIHGLSNKSLMHAAAFCGLPYLEFVESDALVGWISSSYANARGFSTVEQVKIIDAHGGQGIEIQPLSKMGAVSWFAKGNVALLTASGYDPIADLKSLFSSVASGITFKLKAGGSRFYSEDLAISTVSTTAFTASGTAKDDAGTEKIKAAHYIVTGAPISTVSGYLAAEKEATEEGSFTLGVSKSFSATQSSGYVSVLVIAEDGTCSLVCKKIA